MARVKKTHTFDSELYMRLKALAQQLDIPTGQVIEMGIKHLVDVYEVAPIKQEPLNGQVTI